MLFANSPEFESLCNTYRAQVLAGELSKRELHRIEEISRHKAAIVVDHILSSGRAPQAAPETPEEIQARYMAKLQGVADEAVERLTHPVAGDSHAVGYDTPDLPEIIGQTPADDTDVQALIERAISSFDKEHAKRKIHRSQSVRFSGEGPIGIVFSGDEHFGGKTNVRRMLEEAHLVNRTPGLWHARMGDFVNQFILGRMRSIRDTSSFSIKEEWVLAQMLVKLITPKLIAVVGGNHDFWALKASGMDRTAEILPDGILYDAHEVQFNVHVGDAVRNVKMRHRWLGSSQYNPTHAIEKAAKFDKADFDIGVQGHTHTAGLTREFIAQDRRKLAVITNTFKQYDGFADEIGFPRSNTESTCSTVIIEPDGSMFGAPTLEWAVRYMNLRYAGAGQAA